MICPECNVDHPEKEVSFLGLPFKGMTFNCPFKGKDVISTIDGRKQYPDIKRKLMVIVTPNFDPEKQVWHGETRSYQFCCRSMNHQYMANDALRYQRSNSFTGAILLYDPNFFGGEDEQGHGIEYNGYELGECPFCKAEIEIVHLVRE